MTKKYLVGRVISTAMNKTICVSVPRIVIHPKYRRPYTRHTKFLTHDEEEKCFLDDIVKIEQGRKLSKRKCHTVFEILKPAPRVERLPLEIQKSLHPILKPKKHEA